LDEVHGKLRGIVDVVIENQLINPRDMRNAYQEVDENKIIRAEDWFEDAEDKFEDERFQEVKMIEVPDNSAEFIFSEVSIDKLVEQDLIHLSSDVKSLLVGKAYCRTDFNMEDEYVINGEIIKDTLAMSILYNRKKIKPIQSNMANLSFNYSSQDELSDLVDVLNQKIGDFLGGDSEKAVEIVSRLKEQIAQFSLSDLLKLENYLLKIVSDIKRDPKVKKPIDLLSDVIDKKYNPLKIDKAILKNVHKLQIG